MALRQKVWPCASPRGLCLACDITTVSAASRRRYPAPSNNGAKLGHRSITTQSQIPTAELHGYHQHGHYQKPPTLDPARAPAHSKELRALLRALQTQNGDAVAWNVLQWARPLDVVDEQALLMLREPTNLLYDPELTHLVNNAESRLAVEEIASLPASTFSEVLRTLDPALTASHGAVPATRVSYGETALTPNSSLVDEFGVRSQHWRLALVARKLAAVRIAESKGLQPHDFDILLRLTGAANDWEGSMHVWAQASASFKRSSPYHDFRSTKTYTEFLKARFATEPINFQYDRARVAVRARDIFHLGQKTSGFAHLRLTRLEYSINSLKRQPWNRDRRSVDQDMRRLYRMRGGFKSFRSHFARVVADGKQVDEEFLCTAMIAFSRSMSLHRITQDILQRHYGVQVDKQPGIPAVAGGFEFPPDSLLKPTTRLLDAIVDAFGCMSKIPLGLKLLTHLSRHYGIPIPHKTWSNMLAWAYVSASKPISTGHALSTTVRDRRTGRKWKGPGLQTKVKPLDILVLWDMMQRQGGVQPSFEDYDRYIKLLIVVRDFDRALEVIRTKAMPYYQALVEEHHRAVADEVLQNDVRHAPWTADRRRRAEAAKDHAYFAVSNWAHRLLRRVKGGSRLNSDLTSVTVPNIIREFSEFLPETVQYNVQNGRVQLRRVPTIRRQCYTPPHTSIAASLSDEQSMDQEQPIHDNHVAPNEETHSSPDINSDMRYTLPFKKGSRHVFQGQATTYLDSGDWPMLTPMRIFQRRRRARPRRGSSAHVPREPTKEWWNRVKQDMLL